MDLIDRYLVAVRRHLPRPLQKDIVTELSDNLRSEAEETEQRLGRPLTADDQSALLKRQGHPWLVASRYLPQQYLVGPALYPYYLRARRSGLRPRRPTMAASATTAPSRHNHRGTSAIG